FNIVLNDYSTLCNAYLLSHPNKCPVPNFSIHVPRISNGTPRLTYPYPNIFRTNALLLMMIVVLRLSMWAFFASRSIKEGHKSSPAPGLLLGNYYSTNVNIMLAFMPNNKKLENDAFG